MKEKNTFKFYRQRLATNKLSLSDKTAAWWLLVCFAQNTFVAYHPPWSQTPESNNYKMVWLIPEAIIAIPKSSHAMEKFTTSINGTIINLDLATRHTLVCSAIGQNAKVLSKIQHFNYLVLFSLQYDKFHTFNQLTVHSWITFSALFIPVPGITEHPEFYFETWDTFFQHKLEVFEWLHGAGLQLQMAPANVLEGCSDVSDGGMSLPAWPLWFTQRAYYSGVICEGAGRLCPPISLSISLYPPGCVSFDKTEPVKCEHQPNSLCPCKTTWHRWSKRQHQKSLKIQVKLPLLIWFANRKCSNVYVYHDERYRKTFTL